MTIDDRPDSADLELPVGELVATEPATIPGPRTLEGRWVTLRPVDAKTDGADLHRASYGGSEREALWTYMAYGPFAGQEEMRRWLDERSRSADPLFYTVVENASSKAVGMAAFQRFVPQNRCIEIAQIWYAPEQQRTRVNTETAYLLL